MKSLKRYFALPWADRLLLVRTFRLVGTIRIVLYAVPFRHLLAYSLKARKFNAHHGTKLVRSVDKLAWAVTVASRYVPKATCLTQALALQTLLSRSGYPSKLEIGVANEPQRGFEAHAWVICGDRIVIGGGPAEHFTPLASWSNEANKATG